VTPGQDLVLHEVEISKAAPWITAASLYYADAAARGEIWPPLAVVQVRVEGASSRVTANSHVIL
jgi:hypothetical protein